MKPDVGDYFSALDVPDLTLAFSPSYQHMKPYETMFLRIQKPYDAYHF